MWESALWDGHRPTGKETIQLVEYGKDAGDGRLEGRHGRQDSTQVSTGKSTAGRTGGRAHLNGWKPWA
jgi:hypothetical protein